jgi:RNA polymerase sigma-70 factor, ECF subfamily
MNDPDDEFVALMARVRLDDSHALATLIAIYEPEIRRAAGVLLSKGLRSSLDPTDLMQSVHLELIHGLKQGTLALVSSQQLRALAVTLLRHKVIQHWRRHRCQTRHHMDLAGKSSHTYRAAAVDLRERDPALAAEYKDVLDHLYRQLRLEDRRLVVMRLEGYRMGEIATELGTDPVALRMRLSRLRRRLRLKKPPAEWV